MNGNGDRSPMGDGNPAADGASPADSWADAPVPAVVAVLPVADLDRSLAFYLALGFVLRSRYEDHYAIVGYGGAELHLGASAEVAGTFSWSGCYLRVEDAAAVHRRWIAAGAREISAPAPQPYGQLEFATEDPDGNLWRVGSPIPAEPGEPATAPSSPTNRGNPERNNDVATGSDPALVAQAPTDGSTGTTTDSWFDIVAGGRCAGCGLDLRDVARDELSGRVRYEASLWPALLASDDDAIRVRPRPSTWSALEYGAHVRDVLSLFADRVMRMLAEDSPELGWWDHEAAIDDGWDNELEAAAVADDLLRNADHLGAVLDRVPNDDGWPRVGVRRAGEEFTIELLARFALHELVHHRQDAQQSANG